MKSLNNDGIGICILAYKRLIHLKKTLNAILKFIHKSDKIYIFLDHPPKKVHVKDKKKFEQVNNFCNKIQSKKIFLKKSKINLGPKKSWYLAYDYMFTKYNKVIVIEEDIIIKKNFFNFMKYYLNKFENNKNVMSVTGYSTPVDLPKNYKFDCYISNRSMSWSKATWKRVWLTFKNMKNHHKKIINNRKNLLLLSKAGEDLIRTIKLDYLKIVNSFQVWWIWNMVQHKGLSINPVENLIINTGFDGSGYHTNKKKNFIFNKVQKKFRIRMKSLYFLESINNSFIKNFKIKKIFFLFYLYFNTSIINKLLKIKIFYLK